MEFHALGWNAFTGVKCCVEWNAVLSEMLHWVNAPLRWVGRWGAECWWAGSGRGGIYRINIKCTQSNCTALHCTALHREQCTPLRDKPKVHKREHDSKKKNSGICKVSDLRLCWTPECAAVSGGYDNNLSVRLSNQTGKLSVGETNLYTVYLILTQCTQVSTLEYKKNQLLLSLARWVTKIKFHLKTCIFLKYESQS
jgi:hypothetical protein